MGFNGNKNGPYVRRSNTDPSGFEISNVHSYYTERLVGAIQLLKQQNEIKSLKQQNEIKSIKQERNELKASKKTSDHLLYLLVGIVILSGVICVVLLSVFSKKSDGFSQRIPESSIICIIILILIMFILKKMIN